MFDAAPPAAPGSAAPRCGRATSAPAPPRTPVVALVGNPNTGKSSLFNALTGYNRQVANYPGVTVDIARGPLRGAAIVLQLLDLPGTYSLAAASPDEQVLCDVLFGHRPDVPRPAAVLAIADASNPVRNLYLMSQLLETGLPVVLALNMVDIAAARGIAVDARKLSERLGIPIVPVVATQPKSVAPLVAVLERAVAAEPATPRVPFPGELRQEAERLAAESRLQLTGAEALRAIVDAGGSAERQFSARGGDPALLAAARSRLAAAGIEPAPAEVRARYAWIDRVLNGVVERRLVPANTWTGRIDRVLTNRVTGLVVLAGVLYGLFTALYAGAQPLTDLMDAGLSWLAGQATDHLPPGGLRSLITDGLLAGMGGVLAFLPQILILFLFIAILEDCGYLARVAFMVDRLMRPLGLSGRAFIPLLSSFACTVPAIMGARAIADRRERLITILIAPFMSCSARLPIYVLMTGAFVPPVAWLAGWVRLDALIMLGIYALGAGVGALVALLLRHTAFAGPPAAFLLELPGYRWPRLRTVWQRVYLSGRSFLVRAGTIILAVNLVVWALGYWPQRSGDQPAAAALRDSYLGRLGRAIEPAIAPLGWDWRIGVGVLASFPARETIIAALGTVAQLEAADGASNADEALRDGLRRLRREDTGAPLLTLPVALSIMVFFALCAQCASTLVVMGRETGAWGWPVLSFAFMTTLAYLAAWGVAAGGRALGL